MEELLQVGGIANTHGIKGEVKVFPTTDDPGRFKNLSQVKLYTGNEYIDLEIESIKFFKQLVILKFKGIDDINVIEKYKGNSLWITREQAVTLEQDEYFIADMLGMAVLNKQGEQLGVLKEVLTSEANDVYVVSTKDQKELLLPAIKQCILQVNIEERWMKVHVMEGLK